MAKVTQEVASEDDPIYKEGFHVSSHSYSKEYAKAKKASEIDKGKKKDQDVNKDEL